MFMLCNVSYTKYNKLVKSLLKGELQCCGEIFFFLKKSFV